MTDTGVFRLGARSAKGLSSSMKGEPPKGDTCPYPVDVDVKSPLGGELILSFICLTVTMGRLEEIKNFWKSQNLAAQSFLIPFRVWRRGWLVS